MVETSVRHPKLYALLAGAVSLVAAVALIGPADGGPVGVDAASATSPDTSETIPSPPTSDDGVVLTAPGELVEVFVPPSTSEDVEVTGATPATTTAPSVTSPPESAPGSNASAPTTAPVAPMADGEPSDTGEGDEAPSSTVPSSTLPSTTDVPMTTVPDSESVEVAADVTETDGTVGTAENASTISAQTSAGSLLMSAPELSGTANGTTIDGPNLVGQLGTRDSSSVPWMLLIAANFAVTVGALVFLRLRR